MLPERVFEFGQAELHLQDRGREGFAEAIGLFRGTPVRELRQGASCIFDYGVLHPILKSICPDKDALHAGGVWCDDADGGKPDAVAVTSSYIDSNQSEVTCPAPDPISARMIGLPSSR